MGEAGDNFRLGCEAFKAGDFDKAIEELETATHQDHDNHKAFCYLGAAYAADEVAWWKNFFNIDEDEP